MIEANEQQSVAADAPTASLAPVLTPAQRNGTIAGLMVTLFLAALDQTVVGTAMPRVIAELHGFERYAWVTTGYLLTTTLTLPIVARLSDLYGRKWLYLGGAAFFTVTSWLCGAAGRIPFLPGDGMTQLILSRGLQGIGAGIITALTFTIIGDLFSPAERGRYQGLFTGVWGLASILGPGLGGWLTDHLSWRWVFYVNAPFGALAVAILWVAFPSHRPAGRRHAIDALGTVCLAGFLVPLLLALSSVTDTGWTSPRILGLFAVSALLLVAFLAVERRATEPILPLSLFGDRVIAVSCAAAFLLAVGMFGVLLYMPLFLQSVLGVSATESGYLFMPLMLGAIAGSMLGGQLVSRTGRYKIFVLLGALLTLAGMVLFTFLTGDSAHWTVVVDMLVFGLGVGFVSPIYTIAVQNVAPRSEMGIATAAVQFFRSIGSTVGIALFGTILLSLYHHRLGPSALSGVPANLAHLADNPLQLVRMRAQSTGAPGAGGGAVLDLLLNRVKGALGGAFTTLFQAGSALMVGAFVVNALLPERPLRTDRRG